MQTLLGACMHGITLSMVFSRGLLVMAEDKIFIPEDKIFSRKQFFFNEETDFLSEGGFAQVYKAQLLDKRIPKRVNGGSPIVAAKILVRGRQKKAARLGEG